jgi:hypothetical protein
LIVSTGREEFGAMVKRRLAGIATVCVVTVVFAGAAFGQQPATTVQLPTFRSFSGSTTVTVPDRGSAFLGGVKRAATGRNEFGVPLLPWRPFRNSAIGAQRSAGNMHVTATIHDFEAMDKLLLNQPSPAQAPLVRDLRGLRPIGVPAEGGPQPASASRPNPSGQAVASSGSSASRPAMSVARARALHARDQAARSKRLAEFLRRGQEAEAAGKRSTAEAYYRLVLRGATGELRDQATARLAAILHGKDSTKLAGR